MLLRKSRSRKRSGAALAEFVLVMQFIMVPLMIGLWEMGRVVQVQQIVANAAREGARMGVFGAAQAFGFGAGSFGGTVLADLSRRLMQSDAAGYAAVFALESALFVLAALLALRVTAAETRSPLMMPGE